MTKYLTKFLKRSFLESVPLAFSGSYKSNNETYNILADRYYPVDGVIFIGNMRTDKLNYGSSLGKVFWEYKKSARKVINSKYTNQYTIG